MSEAVLQSVPELLLALTPLLDRATRGSFKEVGSHGCVLRAAVAKAFEFVVCVWQEPPPKDGFFRTATIRGICEDFIVLSFIGRLEDKDRDRAVLLLMQSNLAEGLNAQNQFFQHERPWQPVLPSFNVGSVEENERELRDLSAKLGWAGRTAWPSVWFMAKQCAEDALYNYLYSASSKWVHFSPHLLLRMGWGGSRSDLSDTTEWHFTTSHFEKYYTGFNQTYSLYLLLRIISGPAAALVPPEASSVLEKLSERLGEQLRWPELVTFEEMNRKGPSPIERILMQAAHAGKAMPEV